MTRLLFLALAFCLFAVIPAPAHACGCPPSMASLMGKNASLNRRVLDEKRRSTAVFSGTVTKISLSRNAYLAVTLKVERTWKSVEDEQVTVFTPAGDHNCGFNFEVGQSYLVYASTADDGELWTNHCTRTTRIGVGSDLDLKVLGKGRPPRKKSKAQEND